MLRPPYLVGSIAALTLSAGLTLQAGQQTASPLITVDAIARDGRGAFVGDLSKDDFVVREAGVAQDVATLVVSRGGRVEDLTPEATPPAQTELPRLPGSSGVPGRFVLFVIDDLHLDFVNTGRLRDLLKRIEAAVIHEGDLLAAVSTGPSSVAVDLTYDRKRLQEAIGRMSGSGLPSADIIASASRSSEVRSRARIALVTAEQVIASFGKVRDRRKTVILVSNGYDAPLAGEAAALTRAAKLANAAIYTFDARELLAAQDAAQPADSAALTAHRRATLDSLLTMSEQTGGFTVLTRESVDAALARIDAETGDYYVIGYRAKAVEGPAPTLPLEISVRRPGVEVRHRPSAGR